MIFIAAACRALWLSARAWPPGPRWMGERKGISKDRGTGPRFPPAVVSGSRPKPDPGRGSTVKQRKPTRVKPPKWRIGRLDPWLLATKKTMVFFHQKPELRPSQRMTTINKDCFYQYLELEEYKSLISRWPQISLLLIRTEQGVQIYDISDWIWSFERYI
jgi:hypothetical protein